MSVFGNWIVGLAFLTSMASATSYFRSRQQKFVSFQFARTCLKIGTLSVVLASLTLLGLILRHDFSNGYVYSYSSRSLPLQFLISSFYAGQEGSFLFWALCSSLISLVLYKAVANQKSEPWVMTIFMYVQSFLLLLLLVKSPFKSVWEMFLQISSNQIPVDGQGLNPLLQNLWMAIHPPILFAGFAAMAVPFSLAVAALWKRDYLLLNEKALPWVLFASSVLGLGIMLGAYWAYGVLGWGGYWGWDPVENSSLIPWLVSVALIHTILAGRRAKKYMKTNFALAISSFLLVLYSTFLTRSGILGDASVHAFVDPGAAVYWLLILVLACTAIVGFGLMYVRRKELSLDDAEASVLSRESALGIGAIVVMLIAMVVLFGTSLPLFSEARVEASFYDATNLPIVILVVFLTGISLYFQWGVNRGIDVLKRSIIAIIGSGIGTGSFYAAGVRDPSMVALSFACLFAILANIEVGWKIAKGDPRFLGGKLAHIGVAVFLLGVMASGHFGSSKQIALPLNAPQQVFGHKLTYVASRSLQDGKFAFDVVVERGGSKFQVSPVMFDAGPQGILRTPDIASFFTRDFYVSPISLDHAIADVNGDHEQYTIEKGKTVSIGDVKATFVSFDMNQHGQGSQADDQHTRVGSVLTLANASGNETIMPIIVYTRDEPPTHQPFSSKLMNANIQLIGMNVGADKSTVTVEVQRQQSVMQQTETLVVEASIKPFISLVWGGTIVMITGLGLSLFLRGRE